MSRTTFSGTTVTCEYVAFASGMTCGHQITLAGSFTAEKRGWGIVRVYDGKHDLTLIGDQNGWNNYDLCPTHYSEIMQQLGVAKHNIPIADGPE